MSISAIRKHAEELSPENFTLNLRHRAKRKQYIKIMACNGPCLMPGEPYQSTSSLQVACGIVDSHPLKINGGALKRGSWGIAGRKFLESYLPARYFKFSGRTMVNQPLPAFLCWPCHY
jgi:hypothetical protein